jgi:hypothetical protein
VPPPARAARERTGRVIGPARQILPAKPGQINQQDLIDLATIGAERVALQGLTTYVDWSARRTADLGELVGVVPEGASSTPEDVPQQVYTFPAAERHGVQVEAAPQSLRRPRPSGV